MARGRKRKGFGDKEVDGVEDKQNQYLGRPLTELPACISLYILVRLSVKRILICKRVCKTWRNIISSPEFAKLHFARGEAFPLVRSAAPLRVSRTLYLVEPPEHCSGFNDGPIKMKLDTKLKIPVYDEETVIESVEMDPPPKSGVKLRAEHHELKIANSCNGLLFPPPPFKLWKIHKEMTWEWVLGVLGGCLCVCDGSGFEKLKIWVMKEYGVQESWSKELCFITQTNEGRWINGTYDPICLLRNGAIVLFHSLSGALFYHDPKKHGFKFLKPQDGYKSPKYVAIAHIPSFISLKDVVKRHYMAVLPTKSRCAEFKLQGECKDVFLVEEDPAMTWF
ncbi:hypothetical protein RHGRI_019654 [Rhododendron griersonianum]|uniref:F-box domain-containing protein n=1 Tax=Rhododendron griersonianum TaxID=479676 RepID=A0AAV6JEG8_9ERIC|nr:hypothetical protein RHGRI_019654 [Rhododendron griersonianum]